MTIYLFLYTEFKITKRVKSCQHLLLDTIEMLTSILINEHL